MTTIAYKNGILASDSGAHEEGTVFHGVKKVFRVRGMLIGGAGTYIDILAFVKWMREGAVESQYPKMTEMDVLVVHPNGKILLFEHPKPLAIRVRGKYCAIGSGCDFALGAMHAGASAVAAVRAARAHNSTTVGRTQVLSLHPTKKTGVTNGPTDDPSGRALEEEGGSA